MNKKIVFVVLTIIIVILIIMASIYNFSSKTSYELNMPELQNIVNISLVQNSVSKELNTTEEIEDILEILSANRRVTKVESIQDSPVNVNNEIKIDLNLNDGTILTIFVYKKNNNCYIEQPYNGIYKISYDEYNLLEIYIK